MKITVDIFRAWLLDNQAFNAFVDNLYEVRGLSLSQYWEKIAFAPGLAIKEAFTWASTKQGEKYWTNLNNCWKKFYKEEQIPTYQVKCKAQYIAKVDVSGFSEPDKKIIADLLKKKHPEITNFIWDKEHLIGYQRKPVDLC